jgi:hypothetical protein
MLRGIGLYLIIDISRQHIGPIFKVQAAKEENRCKPFMMGPMLSRNVGNQLPTYAMNKHPRTANTTLQLHYKHPLVYTAQADFIVTIKVSI